MKELTIQDIETIVHRDETRVMEAKETTGELVKGMHSGCAFLNSDGGWLFFGIHPTKLTILGQDVADRTPYTYDGTPYYKVENTTMPMPREMFDERIRLSNPKKFSWELTACEDATLRDIDNKTLVAAINKGINKGRSLQAPNQRIS